MAYINNNNVGYGVLMDGSLYEFIRSYVYYNDGSQFHNSIVVLPDDLVNVPSGRFANFKNVQEFVFPSTLKTVESYAFDGCNYVKKIILPHGLEQIEVFGFRNCNSIEELYIPNTIAHIVGDQNFVYMPNLKKITLEANFNVNCNTCLLLSSAPLLSVDMILGVLYALADRSGEHEAYTLHLGSHLSRLTQGQIAIATNKNWNLV